jgi:hypothetical protein
MPRTKETRNFTGSIFKREIKKDSKLVNIWEAHKRNKNLEGENKVAKPDFFLK